MGFAEKSRNIVIGTDNILKNKKVKLIIVSSELGESSLNKLENLSAKTEIGFLKMAENEFFEIVSKNGVKAIAVTDENLANAIKNYAN